MKYSKEEYLQMYSNLTFARTYEMKFVKYLATGKLPGFYHLCIGQEAVQIGIYEALKATGKDDWISPHQRCHPLYALKAGVKEFTCEMIGKPDGINGGVASYVHCYMPEQRVAPSSGILGGNQAIGAGIAMAQSKLDKNDNVMIIGCGDGTLEEGIVSEVLNMISLYNLKVVFYVEYNKISISTKRDNASPIPDSLEDKAKAFGLPVQRFDGNDLLTVRETMADCIEQARAGQPNMVFYDTQRWRGHFEGDTQGYRTKEEIEEIQSIDCIKNYKEYLVDNGIANADELKALDEKQDAVCEEAFEYAMAAPMPTPEHVLGEHLVYAD